MNERDEHPGVGWGFVVLISAVFATARGFVLLIDESMRPEIPLTWLQYFMSEIAPSFFYGFIFTTVFALGTQLFTKKKLPEVSNLRLGSYILIYCITGSTLLAMTLTSIAGVPFLQIPKVALLEILNFYPMYILLFIVFMVIALALRFTPPDPENRDRTNKTGL